MGLIQWKFIVVGKIGFEGHQHSDIVRDVFLDCEFPVRITSFLKFSYQITSSHSLSPFSGLENTKLNSKVMKGVITILVCVRNSGFVVRKQNRNRMPITFVLVYHRVCSSVTTFKS